MATHPAFTNIRRAQQILDKWDDNLSSGQHWPTEEITADLRLAYEHLMSAISLLNTDPRLKS